MRKPFRKWGWILLPLLAGSAVAGETPSNPSVSEAGRAVAGSQLILTPALPFERAVLRVVGPGDYRAQKSYSAGLVLSLDLLREGWVPAAGEDGGRLREALPASLPDGRYRYEAVFERRAGTARVHGSLVARGGGLRVLPVAGEREQPAAADGEAEGAPTPEALVEAESLVLTDNNNNELTLIQLQANDEEPPNSRLENWEIENRGGDFRIVEDNGTSADDVRLAILQDTDDPMVGIGTAAPQAQLHVVGSEMNTTIQLTGPNPTLLLENTLADGFLIAAQSDNSLLVQRLSDFAIPFFIEGDATSGILILKSGEVEIGGQLQVNGDLSVLSSRTAKKDFVPALPQEILARVVELPIQEWSYKDGSARHMGPVAEEFHAAFALGSSKESVNPLDLSGVALAAIQGLQAELADERAAAAGRLAERDREIARLAELVAELDRRVKLLEVPAPPAPNGLGEAHSPGGVSVR